MSTTTYLGALCLLSGLTTIVFKVLERRSRRKRDESWRRIEDEQRAARWRSR
jgi:hypothetical protein